MHISYLQEKQYNRNKNATDVETTMVGLGCVAGCMPHYFETCAKK